MDEAYELVEGAPSVADFISLRVKAGMAERSVEAVSRGLPNSLFAVHLRFGSQTVGMGRLVGDGGCVVQVADIAVLPEHQGKGLGKQIMSALMAHIEQTLSPDCYVSLIADLPADRLYSQFGFEPVGPVSIGMARPT